jgi:membrane-associated phospholipid phosphatase
MAVAVLALVGAAFMFDEALWNWLRAHQTKPLLRLADFFSRYGDWPEFMVAGGLLLVVAFLMHWRKVLRLVLYMMLASTIAGALVNSVRVTSGRPRPNAKEIPEAWYGLWRGGQFLLFKNKYHSFPSGHTAAAFGFFGILAFARPRFGWLFFLVAFAIGWARVYIGAHHLSDVLIGSLVGLFVAWLIWTWWRPKFEGRSGGRETIDEKVAARTIKNDL